MSERLHNWIRCDAVELGGKVARLMSNGGLPEPHQDATELYLALAHLFDSLARGTNEDVRQATNQLAVVTGLRAGEISE